MMRYVTTLTVLGMLLSSSLPAETIPELTAVIRAVKPNGEGHKAAITAWKQLSKAPASKLTDVLAGMDGANKLAINWLRAAADTIAQRETRDGGSLPVAALEEFIADHKHHPRARRTAYELIATVDPEASQRIIPGLIDDPSLELRRDAVALALNEAKTQQDPSEAVKLFTTALSHARDLDQIQLASKALRDLDQEVDLPTHFGFLMSWDLIGPFDNTDTGGFNEAYPPESEVMLTSSYRGKDNVVKWSQYTTEDEYGLVDLNQVLGKHKGAIVYAHTTFRSANARPAELRLGCINGNKVWLNGELLTSNHVYHASTSIDQYIARGNLKKGLNHILIKVAQNEQEESWAQRWQFQLRVCDERGTAVLASDR